MKHSNSGNSFTDDMETKTTLIKDNSNDVIEQKWYHINTSMIPAKLTYFFDAARRISYIPFLVNFFGSIGLNKAEAGFIVGFRLIGTIIGSPFWAMIADKKQIHRFLFLLLHTGAMVFLSMQVFLSLPFGDETKNKCPLPSYVPENNSSSNNTLLSKADSFQTSKRKTLFFVMLIINTIAAFFEGSLPGFIDLAVVRKINLSVNRRIDYGKQRLFSPLGAIPSGALTAAVVLNFPSIKITCYSGVFLLYIMWSLLTMASSFFLFRGVSIKSLKKKYSIDSKSKTTIKNTLKETCLKLDTIIFFITTIIEGYMTSIFFTFRFPYLKELNASKSLLSLIFIFPNVGTIPILYHAHSIIKFLRGPWKTIAFVFGVYSFRYLTISFLDDPWHIIIVEIIQCFTTPLFIAAGVQHTKKISPANILTTMCAAFNLLKYSIGVMIGSSVCGYIYEEYGGRMVYRTSGIFAGAACIFVCIYIALKGRFNSSEEKCDENFSMNDDQLDID